MTYHIQNIRTGEYWNNHIGWVNIENADVFAIADRWGLSLPLDGRWIINESILTDEIRTQHQRPYAGRYLDNSYNEERAGYPQMHRVLRTWSMEMLKTEAAQFRKAAFDRMFGQAARKTLAVIEEVIAERDALDLEA